MKSAIFYTFCVLVSASLQAHGPGCDCHLAPGSLVPPNGGLLEHTEHHHWVELVDETDPMEIHVHEPDLHPMPANEYSLKARVTLPRRSRAKADVELERKGDYYLARVKIEGKTYRYTLYVDVSHEGHTDTVRFDLEP